jgi:preprotein translocase subunit SecD
MKMRCQAFNIYLLLITFALGSGCQTSEESKRKKEQSMVRLHLEMNPDGSDHVKQIMVFREQPIAINIDRNHFLDSSSLTGASVIDTLGGFAIQLKFDAHGTFVLDQMTTAYRGRRVAVFCHSSEDRWLAAPRLSTRITTGIFTFTPDATREEADRIVRGINNFADKLRRKTKYDLVK